MKQLRRAWWSIVWGLDVFALLILLGLIFNKNSVLYWLMDTTYAVWYLILGSVILGISFGTSTRNLQIARFVKIRIPQELAGGRYFTHRVPTLHRPVKGLKKG